MLGFIGAHRVGKTTLAQAYAQEHGVTFVKTSATEVFESLGKSPKADYPIEERLGIQEAILYAFERQYAEARRRGNFYVADRTPIDLASYLLADIQRNTTAFQPEVAQMVNGYVDRCIKATNLWFAAVVLVQPGIPLVEASGKAPACPAYIEHLNALQLGLLLDERLKAQHYSIPRRYTDLRQRLDSVQNAVEHTVMKLDIERKQREDAGMLTH